MITFIAVKQFGRIDYKPKTELAKALASLKGRSLNEKDIKALQAAGMVLEIIRANDN